MKLNPAALVVIFALQATGGPAEPEHTVVPELQSVGALPVARKIFTPVFAFVLFVQPTVICVSAGVKVREVGSASNAAVNPLACVNWLASGFPAKS